MNTKINMNKDFGWEKLLRLIKMKKVIPVIGHGLYGVDVESEGKRNCLLYDYLAEKVLEKSGTHLKFKDNENHKFAKACLAFLKEKKNDYLELSYFLKEALQGVALVQDSLLLRLAKVKNFNIFINTSYDNLLPRAIGTVRSYSTKIFHFGIAEKGFDILPQDWKFLREDSRHSRCTIVYNIFGNIKDSLSPAYTERDILESTIEFQKDMFENKQNPFHNELKSNSLLFIGCGYNDWLFRFFIRTTANKPFDFPLINSQICNFVGDACYDRNKYPFGELPTFLKNYRTELFHSSNGTDFVDLLFEKIEKDSPDQIIQPIDYPGKVFISFIGADRAVARLLAGNLRKDGIDVWLDETKFKVGEEVDKKIYKAIDRCPFFIPLISENSKKLTEKGKPKYHLEEWLRAHSNKESNGKVRIIPVKIDGTKWIYNHFEGLYYYKIPSGQRKGEYDKLLNDLREYIQLQNEK